MRIRGTNYRYKDIRVHGPGKLFRSNDDIRTRLSGIAYEPYAFPNREFGKAGK